MKFYVGVTDRKWFRYLRERKPDEVNFWKPSGGTFKALQPGDLFLFKLHAPHNVIAGGGFFVRFQQLPSSLAWEVFGENNGCDSLGQLRDRVSLYTGQRASDPTIGCVILTSPFFFEEKDWIDVSNHWSPNIVQGKGYQTTEALGGTIWKAVRERLERLDLSDAVNEDALGWLPEPTRRRFGDEVLVKPRLGQGGFRLIVTDAYERRCSISGERTLPVLEAAHVRPYAEEGPHSPDNGLLLRSDMHILFDRGYLTVTPSFDIEVSGRIREEFDNGRDYYKFHGKKLHHLPKQSSERPAQKYLEWHNVNKFKG